MQQHFNHHVTSQIVERLVGTRKRDHRSDCAKEGMWLPNHITIPYINNVCY
jgi:hypothetical protein